MLLIEEIFLKPLWDTRHLTDREARLLRDRGFGRTTRRWKVRLGNDGGVMLFRPVPGGGSQIYRIYR